MTYRSLFCIPGALGVSAVKSLQSPCADHQPAKAIYFFLTFGVCLAAVAFAVGSGWIILNWREGIKVFLGIIFFGAIVAGLVLNTIFLVREIRRNEQHDSFINAVTHELKTPIASIRLYLETLQRREVDEAQRPRVLRLDAGRYRAPDAHRGAGAEGGRGGAEESSRQRFPVEFNTLVRECMELARTRHHLHARGISNTASRCIALQNGGGARVLGDPEELRTAVSNLLDNAVKYSPDGVHIAVELDAPDEELLVLRVRDRGVGIPEHELKRIFKRFYRVTQRGLSQVKGTGLGLFIVRSIARNHGGRVFAAERRGREGNDRDLELPRKVSRNTA